MDETQTPILIGEELEQAVASLNVAWSVLPGKGLVRIIPTDGFRDGFGLVSQLATAIEAQRYDPEITLRHDEIEIDLMAFEAGGITARDVEMARLLDTLLA